MTRRAQRSRLLMLALALAWGGAFGCWEQMDDGKWFPQMKRQPAVQAYELVKYNGQSEGFSPPEGTVPVGASAIPDLESMSLPEQDAVENPVPMSYASLENGKRLYEQHCWTCHGKTGIGDGPVAGPTPFAPHAKGPFALVLPIGGPNSLAKVYSDGHIYTTISLGRGRMPNYNRIPAMERWDIVNYVRRELNGQGVQ